MTFRTQRFDGWIVSIATARVLLYSNFMVYAACLPVLLDEWGMSATQAGSIASAFMLSYAVSLFVTSWLADHFGAKKVFLHCAWLSALTAMIFGLFADSYLSALLLYGLAASTQGGLYTPAVILVSDRYDAQRRGTAMGYLIASTSVGYAFSLVITGLCLSMGDYRLALIVTGLMPSLGVVLCFYALRKTPNYVHPRGDISRPYRELWQNLRLRKVVFGYVAHAWELLGMWQWTPAFFATSLVLVSGRGTETAQFGAYFVAAMHIVGSLASVTLGRLSDVLGRRAVLVAAAGISALVSFSLGWMIHWPIYALLILGLVYYFAAIGDSSVWSTALSEAVPPGYLGSVLAIRSLLGFSAGAVAPLAFGAILDLTSNSPVMMQWGLAFAALGVGGLVSTIYALTLNKGISARSI